MQLAQLFNYLRFRFLYPKYRDFLSMGMGIEARYQRNRAYWDKHFEITKSFIRKQLAELPKEFSILILGSGRLYDLPIEDLHRASKITLVDADPFSLHQAKRSLGVLKRKTDCVHLDCTGNVHTWPTLLRNYLQDHAGDRETLKSFFTALKASPFDPRLEPHDVCISLNLLGQIPIYFRERFRVVMEELAGVSVDDQDEFPPDIEPAVSLVLADLQRMHVRDLQRIALKKAIMIYDRYFHYYHRDYSPWESYPGLYSEDVIDRSNKRSSVDSWLWHVAPQEVEEKNYGVIHEIEAISFNK